MLDIDNFRKINEDLGLEAGNRILQELVDLIQKITSKHGIIAHYGGDEFSILLPETDLARAKIIAEQIRSDVEKYDFSKHLAGKIIPVTASIGISSFPDTAVDLETFKQKADEALYKAKELGRNRVEWID
jgi:diguanylate cyclase